MPTDEDDDVAPSDRPATLLGLHNLPVEILHVIFHHLECTELLTVLPRVCRALRQATSPSVLSQHAVVLQGDLPWAKLSSSRQRQASLRHWFRRRAPHVHSLRVHVQGSYDRLTDSLVLIPAHKHVTLNVHPWSSILPSLRRLKALTLTDAHPYLLPSIAQCTGLTKLRLRVGGPCCGALLHRNLGQLSKLVHLQHLELNVLKAVQSPVADTDVGDGPALFMIVPQTWQEHPAAEHLAQEGSQDPLAGQTGPLMAPDAANGPTQQDIGVQAGPGGPQEGHEGPQDPEGAQQATFLGSCHSKPQGSLSPPQAQSHGDMGNQHRMPEALVGTGIASKSCALPGGEAGLQPRDYSDTAAAAQQCARATMHGGEAGSTDMGATCTAADTDSHRYLAQQQLARYELRAVKGNEHACPTQLGHDNRRIHAAGSVIHDGNPLQQMHVQELCPGGSCGGGQWSTPQPRPMSSAFEVEWGATGTLPSAASSSSTEWSLSSTSSLAEEAVPDADTCTNCAQRLGLTDNALAMPACTNGSLQSKGSDWIDQQAAVPLTEMRDTVDGVPASRPGRLAGPVPVPSHPGLVHACAPASSWGHMDTHVHAQGDGDTGMLPCSSTLLYPCSSNKPTSCANPQNSPAPFTEHREQPPPCSRLGVTLSPYPHPNRLSHGNEFSQSHDIHALALSAAQYGFTEVAAQLAQGRGGRWQTHCPSLSLTEDSSEGASVISMAPGELLLSPTESPTAVSLVREVGLSAGPSAPGPVAGPLCTRSPADCSGVPCLAALSLDPVLTVQPGQQLCAEQVQQVSNSCVAPHVPGQGSTGVCGSTADNADALCCMSTLGCSSNSRTVDLLSGDIKSSTSGDASSSVLTRNKGDYPEELCLDNTVVSSDVCSQGLGYKSPPGHQALVSLLGSSFDTPANSCCGSPASASCDSVASPQGVSLEVAVTGPVVTIGYPPSPTAAVANSRREADSPIAVGAGSGTQPSGSIAAHGGAAGAQGGAMAGADAGGADDGQWAADELSEQVLWQLTALHQYPSGALHLPRLQSLRLTIGPQLELPTNLSSLCTLTSLYLHTTARPSFPEAALQLTQLRALQYSCSWVPTAGLDILMALLAPPFNLPQDFAGALPKLTRLVLRGCRLGMDGELRAQAAAHPGLLHLEITGPHRGTHSLARGLMLLPDETPNGIDNWADDHASDG